ncbi:MAG: hypothetical protein AAF902_01585 [Chloroflexota bacterium]
MNTIIPWILGGLILLLSLGVWQTLKFWRESKRSPYYFLRKQAEQKMQTYSMGTVATAVLLLFFVSYARQPVVDNSLRMVTIQNAKPALLSNPQAGELVVTLEETIEEVVESEGAGPEIIALEGDTATDLSADLVALETRTDSSAVELEDSVELAALDSFEVEGAVIPTVEATILPAEFSSVVAEVDMNSNTEITALEFSDGINNVSYAPVQPSRLYNEGFYTVYATFDYDGMSDGMSWAWVWRQDGRVIGGGNELWNYGVDGPGYVYLEPVQGFSTGEYTVEIYVNDTLMSTESMFVTDDLATTSQ